MLSTTEYEALLKENEELKLKIQELEKFALVDEMTGLYNRRGFRALLDQHLKVLHREKLIPHLFYIDMDNLKTINDKLGHEVGDKAIKLLAKTLCSTFRRSDIIARFGGDEFIVLAGISPVVGQTMETRLNRALQKNAPDVQVSIGLVPMGYYSNIDKVLAKADKLMYQKKAQKKHVVKMEAQRMVR